MKCSICKQPEADLKINGYHYHTQCYIDEFGLPQETELRILGKNPSRLKKARLTMLMDEGVTETLMMREVDYYRQRHSLPGQPGCYKVFQQDSDDN